MKLQTDSDGKAVSLKKSAPWELWGDDLGFRVRPLFQKASSSSQTSKLRAEDGSRGQRGEQASFGLDSLEASPLPPFQEFPHSVRPSLKSDSLLLLLGFHVQSTIFKVKNHDSGSTPPMSPN